ncbi:MAG: hypothetical protein U0457_04420 [Candidatus Sericytochromatia bacterium]
MKLKEEEKKRKSKKSILFLVSFYFLLLTFVLSCSISPNVQQAEYTNTENITENSKLTFSTLDFKAYGDKKENEKEDIKTWFKQEQKKHEKLKITNVMIEGTNQRIDEGGTDSITPNYSGGSVNIVINGNFGEDMIQKKDYLFTNEPNLLQLSYVGETSPKSKLLIDDAILLQTTSMTRTQIKAKIDFTAIPDYFLKGLHRLSILDDDDKRTDIKIRIGEPVAPNTSLSPSIEEVKIIKVKDIYYDKDSKDWAFKVSHEDDDKKENVEEILKTFRNLPNTGINLKLKGRNFMMFYKFAYTRIDGKFGFGHSTAISKDTNGNVFWEAIVHIPDIKDFNSKTQHTISYSTPFGTAIKRF